MCLGDLGDPSSQLGPPSFVQEVVGTQKDEEGAGGGELDAFVFGVNSVPTR